MARFFPCFGACPGPGPKWANQLDPSTSLNIFHTARQRNHSWSHTAATPCSCTCRWHRPPSATRKPPEMVTSGIASLRFMVGGGGWSHASHSVHELPEKPCMARRQSFVNASAKANPCPSGIITGPISTASVHICRHLSVCHAPRLYSYELHIRDSLVYIFPLWILFCFECKAGKLQSWRGCAPCMVYIDWLGRNKYILKMFESTCGHTISRSIGITV